MYSRIRYPEKLSPAELDEYLAAGWRCMGQAIYTSHFMIFPTDGGQHVYSTLPTRLALEHYTFRKSLRKISRKVHQQFRILIGEVAHFDEAKKRVNDLYAQQYPDKAISDPDLILDNGRGGFTFDTRELSIYDGDQLIAFSFFAQGEGSIYSKQGIYDPAYSQYSLGFFSMLEEIHYAQLNTFRYYYPGYVVPNYPEFDYKHRIGPLEYFELSTQQWRPYTSLQEDDIAINKMREALLQLRKALKNRGVKSSISNYRHFDIRFYDTRPYPFLEFPIILTIDAANPSNHCPVAVFHPVQRKYTLYNCRFFGQGVHHLEAYRYLLNREPVISNIPTAIFDTYAEGWDLDSTVERLLKIRQLII
jgi:arginyl-tRNA--protein-N-Asp/Glu arginylyltransferase